MVRSSPRSRSSQRAIGVRSNNALGTSPTNSARSDRGTSSDGVVDLRGTNRERIDEVHRHLHVLTDR